MNSTFYIFETMEAIVCSKRITRFVLAFLFIFYGSSSYSQLTVNGYVYQDNNGNDKKDRRENGVARVAVSNGEDVVLTDAKGFYSLSVSDGQTIFVIKPEGFRFPLDSFYLPRFYYHYRPQGSPDFFRYKGIAPTGRLPKQLNFPVIKYDEPREFSAVIFGDPQPYSIADLDAFSKKIVADVKKRPNTIFGISLGDIVGNHLDLQPVYKERMRPLQLTWYNVMGNHDMNFDATTDELSDETFQKNFGLANYSFNHGDAHFIILDDILYPDPRDGKSYWAGYRDDQFKFLENNLKLVPKNKLIVISQHIQMKDTTGNGFRQKDKRRLFALLKDYENVVALSAHTHFQEQLYYTEKQGWNGAKPLHEYNVGTTSGDWYSGLQDENGMPDGTMRDGTPQGYAFLNISGNQYNFDYKVAGKPDDYQMTIFAPKVVPRKGRTTSQIFVNFFMGSKDDVVEYRVGNGDWKKMDYTEKIDPSFNLKLVEWDLTERLLPGRRPSAAVNSSHLWSGNIPLNLPVGEHAIEVRATDRYGKVHFGKRTYKILER